MSQNTPKASSGSLGKKGNPNWTEKDPSLPSQQDLSETTDAGVAAEPAGEEVTATESDNSVQPSQQDLGTQGRYGDRNPNWTEKDLPPASGNNT
jgi:hypothetical protein